MKATSSAMSFFGAILSCAVLAAGAARADTTPTATGPASATETAFIKTMQAGLMRRFPTAADAQKAGYVRYTNEDETGAISYANLQWHSIDARHPSQLWYGAHGNLLGADFSVLKTSDRPPKLWGVDPGRWSEFDGHVHYVLVSSSGALSYDHWVMNPAFAAAGGDVKHPSAATLVKMGKVKSASEVATIFEFPTIYDLIVWIAPNANGAFADKNPLVHANKEVAIDTRYLILTTDSGEIAPL